MKRLVRLFNVGQNGKTGGIYKGSVTSYAIVTEIGRAARHVSNEERFQTRSSFPKQLPVYTIQGAAITTGRLDHWNLHLVLPSDRLPIWCLPQSGARCIHPHPAKVQRDLLYPSLIWTLMLGYCTYCDRLLFLIGRVSSGSSAGRWRTTLPM